MLLSNLQLLLIISLMSFIANKFFFLSFYFFSPGTNPRSHIAFCSHVVLIYFSLESASNCLYLSCHWHCWRPHRRQLLCRPPFFGFIWCFLMIQVMYFWLEYYRCDTVSFSGHIRRYIIWSVLLLMVAMLIPWIRWHGSTDQISLVQSHYFTLWN